MKYKVKLSAVATMTGYATVEADSPEEAAAQVLTDEVDFECVGHVGEPDPGSIEVVEVVDAATGDVVLEVVP